MAQVIHSRPIDRKVIEEDLHERRDDVAKNLSNGARWNVAIAVVNPNIITTAIKTPHSVTKVVFF